MKTVAFFSYARRDDQATNGLLSKIRAKLETEVRAFAGDEELEVFQDTDDIEPGDIWESKLRDAIDQSAFFLPVLTPYYFNRPACRREMETWLANYRTPHEAKCIIPIKFLPLTRPRGNGSPKDELRIALERLQHIDFSKFRTYSGVRGQLTKDISTLAQRMS
jgi:hypothetical protein